MSVNWEQKALELGRIFKPSTPVKGNLFFGRQKQVRSVVDAINQEGQHVVLYGERGVGKTSLAKQLFSRLTSVSGAAVVIPHINCDSVDTYSSVWRKIFGEITTINERETIGFSTETIRQLGTLADNVQGDITPDTVLKQLSKIGRQFLLAVVVDEFDTIEDKAVRRQFADTIKTCSDRGAPVTIVMIGVSEDVESLIEGHSSVERCLAQVRMPRMSRSELDEILECSKSMEVIFDGKAKDEITGLSKGLPHYTHLLGLHAGRVALDSESLLVGQPNVRAAMKTAITSAQHSIMNAYHIATLSSQKTATHKQVLLACAMANTDELGYFSPVDVTEPLNLVMKKQQKIENFSKKIAVFCKGQRGDIFARLKTTHSQRFKYRFRNPLMQPYVIMRGIDENLIDDTKLDFSRPSKGSQMGLFNDFEV